MFRLDVRFFSHSMDEIREKERWMRSARQNEISDALKCINPLSVEEHKTAEREKELFVFCFATIYTIQFNWIRGHTIALDPNLI